MERSSLGNQRRKAFLSKYNISFNNENSNEHCNSFSSSRHNNNAFVGKKLVPIFVETDHQVKKHQRRRKKSVTRVSNTIAACNYLTRNESCFGGNNSTVAAASQLANREEEKLYKWPKEKCLNSAPSIVISYY